jgi:hypothetical protein
MKKIWREYLDLPVERALALAGDPDSVWVAGAAGARATREEAEQSALATCEVRRKDRRMQAPCRLYAVGDEVVWRTP